MQLQLITFMFLSFSQFGLYCAKLMFLLQSTAMEMSMNPTPAQTQTWALL